MLPRSTACRHGDGRTCTKHTSISSSSPERTMRLPGLMSRWAIPASRSLRIISQPLVDDRVVDLGLADLDRIFEELGDQQVLSLGRDLHDAVGRAVRTPASCTQAQRIVLVFGQPLHRLERGLVFQGAVQDGPAQLVPAVGAHVALGVELGEHELLRAARDPQPQRGRPGGGLQADRLDLGHVQPELVGHGPAGSPPRAGRSRPRARCGRAGRRPGTPRSGRSNGTR